MVRSVSRVVVSILEQVGTTPISVTILAAQNVERTLIRLMLKGQLRTASTGAHIMGAIHIRPNNVFVIDSLAPGAGQDMGFVSDELLIPFSGSLESGEPLAIDIDAKIMRKLQVGDVLVLTMDTSSSTVTNYGLMAQAWFKET